MRASTTPAHRRVDPLADGDVLREACGELLRSKHASEALASAVHWARALLGWDHAAARASLADASGRLRTNGTSGEWPSSLPAVRRDAFVSRALRRVPVPGSVGLHLVVIPLVRHDDAVGVLEVIGPVARLDERYDTLLSLAGVTGHVASALRHPSGNGRSDRRDPSGGISVAWAAHEMRSPLLAATAVLDRLLARSDGMFPEDRVLVERCRLELLGLASSARDLLDWATGSRVLRTRPADVVRIVREAVVSCCLESGQERVEVTSPARIRAHVDPVHLRSAVANLVRNALAYTPEDQTVRVRVDRGPDAVRLTIGDAGPGLAPEEVMTVFRPLVRGAASSANPEGRGLGLFIARRVVEAHGGSMRVSSDAGKGTVFSIELPMERG